MSTVGPQTTFGYGLATAVDPAWTVADIVAATSGRLSGGADVVVRAVVTDSRALEPGDCFVALRGERFDGHGFVAEAVGRGAAGLVVAADYRLPAGLPVPVVAVADTLTALGDLAGWRRRRLPDLQVVAITGSCGKTTVKEMAAAVLGQAGPLVKTPGNYNNLVGLPLSLLPAGYRHRFAVLEMGMNRSGEIQRLTEIAAPDIACITNVHPAHIGAFRDLAAVAAAKEELFLAAPPTARLVVNLDDPLVRAMGRRNPRRQITFGRHRHAMVRGLRPCHYRDGSQGFTLAVGEARCRVRLAGAGPHLVSDALAAAAIGVGCGLELEAIAAGLETFRPVVGRGTVTTLGSGLLVLDDTYNANPGSVAAAVAAAAQLAGGGRFAVLLGDMLELGAAAPALHHQVGEEAGRYGCAFLAAVGEHAPSVAAGGRAAGMAAGRAVAFARRREAVDFVLRLLAEEGFGAGDCLLVKGSRGMRMEECLAWLQAGLAAGGEG